jgi:RNA polymerase sigma factor (sigma-70 family)
LEFKVGLVANIQNKILLNSSFDPSSSEDRVLWESVKKGNELAFSSLFKKFVNPLYNYGMHLHADSDLVKDCVQELFTSIWHKNETLSDVTQVKFYLFKSFRNLLFAKISASKNLIYSEVWEEDCGEADLARESVWIREEEILENSKLVQLAIQGLTARQREAVILRYYNNMESKQISDVMGISVAAVHNLVCKSIQLLRIKLSR